MHNSFKNILIWICILVAWVFDLLLWKHPYGISYFILVVLVLTAGYLVARQAGIKPARGTWILVPFILFFAAMTTFRAEPMTTFLNTLLSILLLALAAVTYTGGKWWNYSFSDYVAKYAGLVLSSLSRLIIFSVQKPTPENTDDGSPEIAPVVEKKSRPGWAILRGIIIALPIVLVLAVLLGAADPIFNKQLEELLKVFRIDRLGEYLFRLFYILVLAYLLAGTYLHAYTQSDDKKLIGLEKPWMTSFLGSVEAFIILGAIDALFLLFVFIQFRYFFGGQGNIHIDGYTYAEYARKGFTEMVMVAVISLLILQVLSTITKRLQKHESNWFSGLSVGLVALVIVILVSAFQRLQLYELAYGFSRIRLYSHLFMIWLGILLVATVAIEILHKQRAFALALVLTILGYGITMNFINVDRFIAQQNIQRSSIQKELDVAYLVSLSEDAVPFLAETYQAAQPGSSLKVETGAALACKLNGAHNYLMEDDSTPLAEFWGSYTWPKANAQNTLENLSSELKKNYPIEQNEDNYSRYVETGQGIIYCDDYAYMD